MLHNIGNQHCKEQEMVGTQKEHQNFQLAAKVASEPTCLVDSTDQVWQVTAKGTRLVSISNFGFNFQHLVYFQMKENTSIEQPSCSSQESPCIQQSQLMIWRPLHTVCLGCQQKMNVNSSYLGSSLILKNSSNHVID